MHGRIRTTPAEHVGAQLIWDEEGCTREKAQAPGAKDSSQGAAAPCKTVFAVKCGKGSCSGKIWFCAAALKHALGNRKLSLRAGYERGLLAGNNDAFVSF